jgi:predicted ATPase/class 3 adenylate cyclase
MDPIGWLQSIGLERYAAAFRENEIDETVLPHLTAEDLKDIGVGPIGHRRKLLDAIAVLPAHAENEAPTESLSQPSLWTQDSGERRQVTVMFVDLVGSTALSTRMDVEDLRDVISAYQKCVSETVHHSGGFVAKYLGDGVLIYFGYPEAHEDDAASAVQAGLELIKAVTTLNSPVLLQARVGIATGLVVVGDLIEEESRDRDIFGEAPNVAARLQEAARPNTVIIAESTRGLIGDLFELEDLGGKDLKGFQEAVRAWAVRSARPVESRFHALRTRGLTALVGREEEIGILLRRWSKAKSGQGQVVLLSGEPGIGKSRLTAVLRERLAAEQHMQLRYYCSPQHTNSALYPIIERVQRVVGLTLDEAPQAKLDKLDAILAQTSTTSEDASLIAEMLCLPNDGRYPNFDLTPEQRRGRTLEALTAQIISLTRRQPGLIVLEDAHWSDPTTLEMVGRVVNRIVNLRALLIVTYRPEFKPPWIGQPHVSTLTINRLTRPETSAMIERVAGNTLIPPNIRQNIIERTDGIPLFVEEMTKAVVEENNQRSAELPEGENPDSIERKVSVVAASALTVPASLHASLTARLDHLGPAKEIAQIGSVIGREFSYALLAAVARKSEAELQLSLDHLVAAGLLFRQGQPPHAKYLFKHALVQNAAYGTLLRDPTRALHAQIADVYERQFQDLVEARPELLADHLARAGFAERAIGFYLKAARAATGKGAVAEAVAQLHRGLALLGKIANADVRQRHEIELQITLGNALMASRGFSSAETDAAFRRAAELCRAADDKAQSVRVLWGQFTGHFAGGRQRAALAVAKELLALSESLGDAGGQQMGHASVGACQLHMGSFEDARIPFERALAADSGREHERSFRYGLSGRVVAMAYGSFNLLLLGFPDRAQRLAERSVEEAQASSHPPSLCLAHSIAGRVCYLRGEDEGLAEHAAMVVRLADEQGLALWQALGSIYTGWSLGESGAAREAINLMRAGIATYRSTGGGLCLSLYYLSLASVEARLENYREALRFLDEAQTAIEAGEERFVLAEIYRLAGEIALKPPESDAAKAAMHFQRALAIAREQRARSWELRAAMSLARLWHDQDRQDEARDLLAPIYSWYSEGFDTPDLKAASSLLDMLA